MLTMAIAFFTVTVAGAQAPAATAITRISWLQGCWESVSPQRTIDEQWMVARGGVMLGMSRTVQDGTLREYELVLIRETPGGLAYEAHPSGQPAATFPMKEMTGSSIVFEDPKHDFPQRIGYRRDDGDRMTAWIEGTANGRSRRVEYPYRRVSCSTRG